MEHHQEEQHTHYESPKRKKQGEEGLGRDYS